MVFLNRVAKDVAKKYGTEIRLPKEYDYWLSEVYYDKGRKHPHSRTEPKIRYEEPEEVAKDLQMMLKDAKKSVKEWLMYDVSDNKKPILIRK